MLTLKELKELERLQAQDPKEFKRLKHRISGGRRRLTEAAVSKIQAFSGEDGDD